MIRAEDLDRLIGIASAAVLIFFPAPEIARALIGWLA